MSLILNGRGERIRTSDPLVPNQVRYQTALRPELLLPSGCRFSKGAIRERWEGSLNRNTDPRSLAEIRRCMGRRAEKLFDCDGYRRHCSVVLRRIYSSG
jgi:hypothetical protein